jgi:hypothetical protein
MQGIFLTLGYGLAGLLGVAVLIALLEHLRARQRPPAPLLPAQPRAIHVDLDLDQLPASGGEGGQRQAATDQVMARMTQPGTGWPETSPMIASSLVVEEATDTRNAAVAN